MVLPIDPIFNLRMLFPRFFRIMSTYIFASIFESILWIVPTPFEEIHPQTMICFGCLMVGIMYFGSNSLFLGRKTVWTSLWPNNSTLTSSLNKQMSQNSSSLSAKIVGSVGRMNYIVGSGGRNGRNLTFVIFWECYSFFPMRQFVVWSFDWATTF